MIDTNAFFKISYGLYIVSAGNKEKGSGFIANTVFQVTSNPPQFAICCNKNNYTSELIQKHGSFSASVLSEQATKELFGTFGYKSGKEFDKFALAKVTYTEAETPVVHDAAIAFIECRVIQQSDVGTHILYIGELISAEMLDETAHPITYSYYQEKMKGKSPKNAPTYVAPSTKTQPVKEKDSKGRIYTCGVCGYEYIENDEEKPFSDLPEDWQCPVCGVDKSNFDEKI